ncbi:hypothetical protein GCM10011490_15400 [Pseudoclavibacter endophyticus]|uniref:Bacterial SCP orthologue domain-containing protein n=1 Tax=Pseudoclavibacter endophyticus TaxID=1778590 RepID=A0A6H9WRY7_9MICO|nr:sterol carrier family protein [Pseudoclavibacter endophyticus]KAB1649074.1 hypothetical protein F8O04_01980 [Pseudoclavibacter endophyticus]GGA65668.1 hypothetical protein GCM10011490_15400 [Pseudoclavibacter endophyticus]
MAKARISEAEGRAALDAWVAAGEAATRTDRAAAVRYTLQVLAERAPGASVEVRVPPFGAVQCIEGPGHTRGTPPNVVEVDTETWLALATGRLSWNDAMTAGVVRASGTRASLEALLPVVRLR